MTRANVGKGIGTIGPGKKAKDKAAAGAKGAVSDEAYRG